MQVNRGHDAKACLSCGVLNRIPYCETRPQIIQCAECGQDIALSDAPSIITSIINRIRQIKLSRRTFNQTTFSIILFLLSPYWNNLYNKLFNGKNHVKPKFASVCVQPEPATCVASASIGAVVVSGASAGEIFTAEVKTKSETHKVKVK
jgi:hypothetical protein